MCWRGSKGKSACRPTPIERGIPVFLWITSLFLSLSTACLPQSAAKKSLSELTVLEAFQQKRSRIFLETRGEVIRVLTDDLKGVRHQRFLIRTDCGVTLLISHSIDLAERVPVREGTRVQLRGEYIWNTQGGLMHWTHHDPKRLHEGGWIKLTESGKAYR